MTKFDELQQAHQQLLDRVDKVVDRDTFVREVQDYVTRVCDEAEYVPAPRDRDQLRANLRFWASYLYDATGRYPNTTMRPARPEPATPAASTGVTPRPAPAPPSPSSAPMVSARSRGKRLWITVGIIAGIIVCAAIVGVLPGISPWPGGQAYATQQPGLQPAGPHEDVSIEWKIMTEGPSPFDPNVWAAHIKLSAKGGNGAYIYWVDDLRLPDASDGEFTVEGQGCEAKRAEVGVTSDGKAASEQLEINSPLSQCK